MATRENASTAIDRGQLEQFLRTCIDTMKSEDTREMLKAVSSGRPGAKIAEIQKGIWDKQGIDVQAGRRAVGKIDKNNPDDCEVLVPLKKEFAETADMTYIQCLEDRRPKVLKKTGLMIRNTVLEFFDACNVKMDMPEGRERLRNHIKEKGTMPDDVVNELHDEVMELLGFDREHGQSCFKELGTSGEFAEDREVAMAYARWRGKTNDVCATLLHEYQKEGGEVKVSEEVKARLLDVQAKEKLDNMSFEERSKLLEKNAKKVNVFRGLPSDARQRYLEKLEEADKLELTMAEILMVTIKQHQQQRVAQDATGKVE